MVFKKMIKCLLSMVQYVFYCMPIEQKIVFINFNGKGFGCNPKYIALGCIEKKLPYKLVWMIKHYDSEMPKEIKQVCWGKIRFYYELSTAKIIVTNVKNSPPFRKRNGQYLLQTWHGANAYKVVEGEAIEYLSKEYITMSRINSKITDIFLSDGKRTTAWYRKYFWCDCDIEETGFPRNDILIKNSSKKKGEIKRKLKIMDDVSLVLYAPTFRDNDKIDVNELDFDGVIKALHTRFGGNWMLLIRRHPNDVSYNNAKNTSVHNVMDVSNYGDIQELELISDVLITDYSTVCNDFMLMERPFFLFANDYDSYIIKSRKIKKNYYDIPARINKNNMELISDILNFNKDEYIKSVGCYSEKYLGKEDGLSTKRVVDIIDNLMNDGRKK